MMTVDEAVSPGKRTALHAAIMLDACCGPHARVLIRDDSDSLAPLLQSLGLTVLLPDEHGAEAFACAILGPCSQSEIALILARLPEGGLVVFDTTSIASTQLEELGFAPAPLPVLAGTEPAVSLAVKRHEADIGALAPLAVSSDKSNDAALQALNMTVSDLDRRLAERLDRLLMQSTQLANAFERLIYAVSLKGKLVGVLRRTGTLGLAASLLAGVRKVRAKLAQGRAVIAGPVMQLAVGVAVHGPIVIASAEPLADEIEAAASQKQVGAIRLKPSVVRTEAQASILTRPDVNELAGWLALREPVETVGIRTFMVDLDSGGVALNLLRGRLSPDQAVVLVRQTKEQALPEELGSPDLVKGRMAYYAAAPAPLRQYLDKAGRPLPGAAPGSDWPKISMVMVSFNQAAFLEEGICSILDQGYPNLEFILVDGGSTDGSVDIIERYRDRLDKVVIERDRGQSDGLNKGFDLATGDILSWLNSDDLLLPGALAKVGRAFPAYGADMIVGGCKQVQQNGRDVVVSHHNHLPIGHKVALPLNELLDFDNRWQAGAFFYQPEVFFSRDIWLRSGGGLRLDLYYVLDYDLWIRMAAAGATIVHIPDFLAASRIHDQQKTIFGENPFIPETRLLLAEYSNGVHWTRPPKL